MDIKSHTYFYSGLKKEKRKKGGGLVGGDQRVLDGICSREKHEKKGTRL